LIFFTSLPILKREGQQILVKLSFFLQNLWNFKRSASYRGTDWTGGCWVYTIGVTSGGFFWKLIFLKMCSKNLGMFLHQQNLNKFFEKKLELICHFV
jgi:hypothetical protein